jgi:hypothetical protein
MTRLSIRNARSAVVVGVVAAVVTAGVAAAAAGMFDVGSTIPGDERGAPGRSDLSVDETVLAAGQSPVGGPWRITSYASEGVRSEGEIVEPEGLGCLRLTLVAPSAKSPVGWSGFCGEPGNGGFAAGSVPVVDDSGNAGLILFGPAPGAATAVVLRGPDGRALADVRTSDDPTPDERTLWALEVTGGLDGAELVWLDEKGDAAGSSLDAADFSARLAIALRTK